MSRIMSPNTTVFKDIIQVFNELSANRFSQEVFIKDIFGFESLIAHNQIPIHN